MRVASQIGKRPKTWDLRKLEKNLNNLNRPSPPQTQFPDHSWQPLGPSHSLNFKLELLSCEKVLNFVLLRNYFSLAQDVF